MNQKYILRVDTAIDFLDTSNAVSTIDLFRYVQDNDIAIHISTWNGPAGGWPDIKYIAEREKLIELLTTYFEFSAQDANDHFEEFAVIFEEISMDPIRRVTVPFNGIENEFHNILVSGITIEKIDISAATNGNIEAVLIGRESDLRDYFSNLWNVDIDAEEINELF